jgi:hypothetical protein
MASSRTPVRGQLVGAAELVAALEGGAPLRLVLVAREPQDAATTSAVERARVAGVPVRSASVASLRRRSCSP